MAECEAQGVPLPVVCQPYYNLLNRMPEVEILPACDHYGIGVASYSPDRARSAHRQVRTRRAAARGLARRARRSPHHGDGVARGVVRVAQKLAAHAAKTGRTLTQFALAWLWANRIVTSVIAGPRTLEQWQDYVDALGTDWSDEDEALVDSLVAPGHPSTPGYNDPQYPFFGRVRD